MYSTIANNSFSYLLTLDEIRKALPDETRPSWVKITTITMVSSFIQQIDIKRLRGLLEEIGSYKMRRSGTKTEGFEWKLKPTTFYNQVTLTYHDTYSTKSVKVFPNGSIHHTAHSYFQNLFGFENRSSGGFIPCGHDKLQLQPQLQHQPPSRLELVRGVRRYFQGFF